MLLAISVSIIDFWSRSNSLLDTLLAEGNLLNLSAHLPRSVDIRHLEVGDVTVPAHWFENAGLEGILPLERQAGVDIAILRQAHPGMRFIGHFDKMTMNKGETVMRAEFERLLPTAAKGGFLPSCDHQTPPGVSYRDYQLYLALFREYAAEVGRLSRQTKPG